MKENQVKIPTADEVRRWVKVQLKKRMTYGLLPRLQELLEKYDDAIFEVFEIGKDAMKVCACKKTDNKHAPDCVSNPHLMVHVFDPNDNNKILEIRSMFLEPVELSQLVKSQVEKTEDIVKAGEVLEKLAVGIVETKKDCDEKKYVWIKISPIGEFEIVDVESMSDSNFIFDTETLEWILGDFGGKVGESIPLDGKDWINGFVVVLEGQEHDVFELVFSFATILKNSIKSILTKEINKI